MAIPVPPAAVTSSAVFSIVSGRAAFAAAAPGVRLLRPVQYTVAPASPSIRAMPRPAPRVAPATTATRSFRGLPVGMVRCSPRTPRRRLRLDHDEPAGDHRALRAAP